MRWNRAPGADESRRGTFQVFDIRVVDEPSPTYVAPDPRARHWHLWHRWELVRVDAHTTYVACAACGRMRTPTLFESPLP